MHLRGLTIAAFGIVLGSIAGGCQTAAKQVGAAAAPAAVQAGLKEANAPDAQRQIQQLVETQAFEKAGRSVGEGVGIGLFNQANKLAGLTPAGTQPATQASGAASQPTTEAATQPGAAASPGAAAVGGLAGGGGLGGFVQSSVNEAFLAATDPKFKEGERAMSEAIGEGFVEGMITVMNKQGPAIGKTIQTQVGPIMQMIIRDQLAPAISDTLKNQLAPAALQVWKQGATETLKLTVRPDIQPDVIKNAENASLGATQGTTKELIDAGLLSPSGGIEPRVKACLWIAAGAAALTGLMLLCLLVLLNLLVLRHLLRRRPTAKP